MEIYFDNSATTRVSPAAARRALEVMQEEYGNPSSLHHRGFAAEQALTAARQEIAGILGRKHSTIRSKYRRALKKLEKEMQV